MKQNTDYTADKHASRQAKYEEMIYNASVKFRDFSYWLAQRPFRQNAVLRFATKPIAWMGWLSWHIWHPLYVRRRGYCFFFFLSFAGLPLSAKTPATPSKPKQELKISPAELFVRLIEQRRVAWKEPEILPGNDLKSRIWGAQH